MCVVVLLALLRPAYAQSPSTRWQFHFGGTQRDVASAVTATDDGGSIIAGYSLSNNVDVTEHHGGADFTDFWIVKTDAAGTLQWQRSLGGSSYDEAHAAVQFADGSVVVAGESRSNDGDVSGHHGSGDFADAWIVKLDRAGKLLWQRSLGGSDYDAATAVAATHDGGVIVAGITNSNDGDISGHHGPTELSDAWVARLNAFGDVLWQRSLGGTDNDEAHAVIQTTDGGYAVAGTSRSADGDVDTNRGGDDLWIMKLDAAGTRMWSTTAGGSANDGANALVELADGKIAVAGYSYSDDGDVRDHHGYTAFSDMWIVTVDARGTVVAAHSYGGSRNDDAQGIALWHSGVIVAGTSDSNDGAVSGHPVANSSAMWVVALDSSGAMQWEKSLGLSDREHAAGIAAFADSAWIVAGTAHATGDRAGQRGEDDFHAVKLVAPPHAAVASAPQQLQIYPNPTSSRTVLTIPQEFRDAENGVLVITDITGHDVMRIEGIGGDHVDLGSGQLRAGTFLVRLMENGAVVATCRLIVQQ